MMKDFQLADVYAQSSAVMSGKYCDIKVFH